MRILLYKIVIFEAIPLVSLPLITMYLHRTEGREKWGVFKSLGFGCHRRTSCHHPAMKYGVLKNPRETFSLNSTSITSGISHTVDGCEILHHLPDVWMPINNGMLTTYQLGISHTLAVLSYGPVLLDLPMVFPSFPIVGLLNGFSMVFRWVFYWVFPFPTIHSWDICYMASGQNQT